MDELKVGDKVRHVTGWTGTVVADDHARIWSGDIVTVRNENGNVADWLACVFEKVGEDVSPT